MSGRKILSALAMVLPLMASGDAGAPEWVGEARQKSAKLGSSLVEALREALASRGPAGGVEVCNTRAPEIAAGISGDRFDVGRTALRTRNPENAPDGWEESVLRRFEKRMTQGADPAGLEAWQVETDDGQRVGRYMKAIPTGRQCVVCHGENIAPELKQMIRRLYPEDQAVGFAPGDLRGAFTVTVDLGPSD